MAKEESLYSKIDRWMKEGLISPGQAEVLKRRETGGGTASVPTRRVQTHEILVYLGCSWHWLSW